MDYETIIKKFYSSPNNNNQDYFIISNKDRSKTLHVCRPPCKSLVYPIVVKDKKELDYINQDNLNTYINLYFST